MLGRESVKRQGEAKSRLIEATYEIPYESFRHPLTFVEGCFIMLIEVRLNLPIVELFN